MKVNCSPFLLIGFWVSIVHGLSQFCPILTPPQVKFLPCILTDFNLACFLTKMYGVPSAFIYKGTEIHCSLSETGTPNGNCSEDSPSLTVARVRCQPHYKSHDGSSERLIRCVRGGIWRRERGFNNFSCHLGEMRALLSLSALVGPRMT